MLNHLLGSTELAYQNIILAQNLAITNLIKQIILLLIAIKWVRGQKSPFKDRNILGW